jgi:hypothetical protein
MTDSVDLRKVREGAVIDVHLLPWRPRQRRIDPALVRENAHEVLNVADDPASLLLSVGVWIALVLAAPALVILIAVAFFPVELAIAMFIAIAILIVRFAGIVPWTVRIADHTGDVNTESYRNVLNAIARVRGVNQDRRIAVEFSWA